MSPRAVRRVVLVICAAGIVGMIVTSIADDGGGAVTFGLITAAAVVALILVTSVAGPDAFRRDAGGLDEDVATELEARIRRLVEAGADEDEVRRLVGTALQARHRR